MINRYTTKIMLRKEMFPHSLSEEEIIEQAIARAKIKRPLIQPNLVTDLLIDETDAAYIVDVNWWPQKRGDQI